MMRSVTRAQFAEGLVELLPNLVRSRPPELAQRRVDEGAARYIAELRHGHDDESIYLLANKGSRVTAIAAVAPSPFDSKIFGLSIGRLQTLEVADRAEAPSVVRATERSARARGFELLFARTTPSSSTLPALFDRDFKAFGATVLYSGRPQTPKEDLEGVEVAEERDEIAEAARVARLAFADTHLSRDSRLDVRKGRALYDAWIKAEADRGARVLIVRERGRVAAVALCRDNQLARIHLGIEQWHLHLLAVHPRFQGAGLGRRVAAAAGATALASGAELLQTGVDTGAIAAQRIYAGMGLLPAGSSLALHKWF
jgi:ribosomal protein S18 acetylase RimI-like enzyme